MPPGRWLRTPAWANPQAIASEPSAVAIQESREIAPTWAMFAGSMMIPEPIMLMATMTVSWTRFSFFFASMIRLSRQRQLVHPRRGLVEELALDAWRQAGEAALLRLLHARVETGGVREVGLEHQIVLADPLDRRRRIALEPVRTVDLAAEVLRRAEPEVGDAGLGHLV